MKSQGSTLLPETGGLRARMQRGAGRLIARNGGKRVRSDGAALLYRQPGSDRNSGRALR